MIDYNKKKSLAELTQEFQITENRNVMLPSLAWACRREGQDENQAQQTLYAIYDAYDTGRGRNANDMQQHHQEIDRAIENAYSVDFKSGNSQQFQKIESVKIDKTKLAEFHNRLNGADWKSRIKKWDDGDKGDLTTNQTLASLFRNCGCGYVAHYGNKADKKWLDIANGFEDYDGCSLYYTLCTFKDKEKRDENNMDSLAVIVIEIDHPHDSDDNAELTEDEKKDLKNRNLEDTCRLLEAIGISPTTITFSGNKSWHCAFRLKTPVSKETVAKNKAILSDAFKILGADPAMTSIVRASRIPMVFPKACKPEERETRQHVVYWDDSAEVEYGAFVEKIVALAESVYGRKIRVLPDISKCCPFEWIEETTDDGESKKKLVWKGEKWEDMIRELGIFKIHRDGNPFYIKQDKQGLYKEMTLDEIGDYVLAEVGRYKPLFKAKLREKRDVGQARWYAGINGGLNPLKDTKDCIFIPFRDRIARITKDGISITAGYGGQSIPENSPSIWHEFEYTDEQSEFEKFLRHACGELENNPEWQKRFMAFKCLAGYLISGCKEHTNWMCIISDESKEENEGGTGKSIFMTGISKVREADYRDERRKTQDARRFEDSDYSPTAKILWKDEIPKNYDWSQDFAPASSGKKIEQKGKNNRIKVNFEDMQKLVYCTNYYPSGLGASFERRRKMYELSNHYKSKVLTPENEFGHILFTDWDSAEWNRFYNFMCECAQFYLRCGSLIESGSRYESEKTESANINSDFILWYEEEVENATELQMGKSLEIEQSKITIHYNNWYKQNYGHYPEVLPRNKKNQWLDVLSKSRGITMKECVAKNADGRSVKVWRFSRGQATISANTPVEDNQPYNDPFLGDAPKDDFEMKREQSKKNIPNVF